MGKNNISNVQSILIVFIIQKKPEEGEEGAENAEEEEELGEPGTVQDVVTEMSALKWAGVGISETEAFRISLSLYRLSAKNNGINLRFWGKILGTNKDYYIAEAEGVEEEEEGAENKYEPSGPNKYTYFVTNNVGGPWTKLPKVTAEEIIAARKLRRYFTGDLEAFMPGHPPFPGKEKNFLRAQLARITASTCVCPLGVYEVGEEDPYNITPYEEDDEEKPKPTLEDLEELTGWVHINGKITEIGRVTPKQITNEDGEEIDDPNGPKPIPPLRDLSFESNQWIIRTAPNVGLGLTPNMVFIRSTRWPGAYAISSGTKFTNLYVGYGVKDVKESYSPEPPVAISVEYNPTEYKEQEDVYEDPHPPPPPGEEGKEGEEENKEEEDE